ncbi:MAG: hypothetical protein ACKVVP_15345 [Chloroflexota bacterium]
MRGALRETSWSTRSRESDELEDRVAYWLAKQESSPSIGSALLIGGTFLAMIVFAISH